MEDDSSQVLHEKAGWWELFRESPELHASAGHPPAQGLWRTGALPASPLLGPLNTQAKGLQRLEGSPLETQKLSVVRRQSTLKPNEDTETVKPEGSCLEDRGLPC